MLISLTNWNPKTKFGPTAENRYWLRHWPPATIAGIKLAGLAASSVEYPQHFAYGDVNLAASLAVIFNKHLRRSAQVGITGVKFPPQPVRLEVERRIVEVGASDCDIKRSKGRCRSGG